FMTNESIPVTLIQTYPITSLQSLKLIISLEKYGFFISPDLLVRVTFLDDNNAAVGEGLAVQIPSTSLPNVMSNSWKEVYQTTVASTATATQARVDISNLVSCIY